MKFKFGDIIRIKKLEESGIDLTSISMESDIQLLNRLGGRIFSVSNIDSNGMLNIGGALIKPEYVDLVPEHIAFIERGRNFDSCDTKALRYNEGKPRWSLIHAQSLVPLVKVLEYGARKYAPYNWQKPMDKKEILDSMARHLMSVIDGEENDPESGLNHMGHIMANAMFYVYHSNNTEK